MNTHAAIAIVWASLMFATPLSILAVRSTTLSNSRNCLILSSATLLATVILSTAAQISFTGLYGNLATWVCAYLAYCYLAASTWRIKKRLIRYAALTIMHTPIALGYVMGTLGFLGLMFIVGDQTDPPLKTEQLTQNMSCDIRGWGMAASDSGYTIRLRKKWQVLPIVEKTMYSVVVNETQSYVSGEGTDCHSAFAAYRKKAKE